MNKQLSEGPELRLLGTSYRFAGLVEREEVIARGYDAVDELREGSEAFLLITCNRVEFYYISDRDLFPDALRGHEGVMYRKAGADAFIHLAKVASGLDSFVPGEEGIMHQITGELRAQEREARIGRLSQIIRQAVSVARAFRATEKIRGDEIVNLLVGKALERVSRRERAAIVGSGRTAKLAYRGLSGKFREVYVVSKRGLMPGEFPGARVIRLEELNSRLGDFDFILSATNTEVNRYLITGEGSRPRPDALLLDISVPRTVSPAIKGHTEVWDMDDAVRLVNGSFKGLEDEEARLAALAMPAYIRAKYRKLSPELSSFGEAVERIIDKEVKEATKHIRAGESSGEVMKKLARRVVNKALAYVYMAPADEGELLKRLELLRLLLEGISRDEVA